MGLGKSAHWIWRVAARHVRAQLKGCAITSSSATCPETPLPEVSVQIDVTNKTAVSVRTGAGPIAARVKSSRQTIYFYG